jgi:predicted nucleic acid-binding Zn ribbon protein
MAWSARTFFSTVIRTQNLKLEINRELETGRPTRHAAAVRKEPFNRGAWAVERERCQIAAERPAPGRHERPVADVAARVLKAWKLDGCAAELRLLAAWPEIVGPQVAMHARPGRLERGLLVIYVANSVWLAELNRLFQKPILENIRRHLGTNDVRALRLQLDPDPPARKAGA